MHHNIKLRRLFECVSLSVLQQVQMEKIARRNETG